ncbi:MAG: hypothetical protein ACOY5F_21095 [Pseudomonadota bacterium]
MTVHVAHRLRFDRTALTRAIAGGVAWGAAVAGGLLAVTFAQCGTICLGQIVETLALSAAAGLVTIGPLALLRRPLMASAQ